jgi:hypothetical protein
MKLKHCLKRGFARILVDNQMIRLNWNRPALEAKFNANH